MNNPPIHTYNRRWYDRISNMTLALLVSQHFPPEVHSMIARNLNQVIDDCRKKQKRDDKHAVSVGQHRVMGLHKASRKLRWYDPDPGMHRAFNFMTTVPERYLADFAHRILQVGHYVEQQRELFVEARDRHWLENTVEGMLRQNVIGLSESNGGFRLMDKGLEEPPRHPRNVAPPARSQQR